MCGIIGIVNVDGRPVEYNKLKVMNDTMRHRGPDGEGLHVDGSVGLAHRRLSIIAIEKILIDHQRDKRYLSERIWSLVFFESWCQQWLDSKT